MCALLGLEVAAGARPATGLAGLHLPLAGRACNTRVVREFVKSARGATHGDARRVLGVRRAGRASRALRARRARHARARRLAEAIDAAGAERARGVAQALGAHPCRELALGGGAPRPVSYTHLTLPTKRIV
mgnify:CR=1 FL=1